MSKRGAMLVLITMITLIVAIVVALMFPFATKSITSGEAILKTIASKDIALIIDTIYAYPYDMEVEYDVDLSGFVVVISQNSVMIDNQEPGSFVRVNDENFPIRSGINTMTLDNPEKIFFRKEDGKLTITG